jgi:hypothetical protein
MPFSSRLSFFYKAILNMNPLFVSGPYTKEVTGPPSLLGDTSGASGNCGACLPHSFINIAFRGQQINITSYTLDCRNFYILENLNWRKNMGSITSSSSLCKETI